MTIHSQSWSGVPASVSPAGVERREMPGAGLGLVRIVVPAGTQVPQHSHGFEQFVQVVSGSGTVETEQGRKEFGPGSIFHFPAGVEHAAEFTTETVLIESNLTV